MDANSLLRAELQQMRRQVEQARATSNRWCAIASALMQRQGSDQDFIPMREAFGVLQHYTPVAAEAKAVPQGHENNGGEQEGWLVVLKKKGANE